MVSNRRICGRPSYALFLKRLNRAGFRVPWWRRGEMLLSFRLCIEYRMSFMERRQKRKLFIILLLFFYRPEYRKPIKQYLRPCRAKCVNAASRHCIRCLGKSGAPSGLQGIGSRSMYTAGAGHGTKRPPAYPEQAARFVGRIASWAS